jgi:hypothetical protein
MVHREEKSMSDEIFERLMRRDQFRDIFTITAHDIAQSLAVMSLIAPSSVQRGESYRFGGKTPRNRTADPVKKAARKRQRAARAKTRKAH